MKTNFLNLLAQLPGEPSAKWPNGARFVEAFSHGTMRVEIYAPKELDPQEPHVQDEIYFVLTGKTKFFMDGNYMDLLPGDAVFVKAGAAHRFEDFTDNFATWVVFWGPYGGEN